MKHRFAYLLAITLVLGAGAAAAQQSREDCERDFRPRSGQPGKDVIWVPTREELVNAMLTAAKTGPEDFVVDLGSGDGRIPIAAAKRFGARALGIEYNPQMVELAQCYVRSEGLEDRVEIRQADIFETDFSDATVLTLYLLSDLNMKLRPTILALRPGTRVVSNSFKMGEWEPDQDIEVENSYAHAYLWIVPAKIGGVWSFREQGGDQTFEVTLEQDFQKFSGAGAGGLAVSEGRLRGADLEFTVIGLAGQPLALAGRVEGDQMQVTARRDGRTVTYVGTRTKRS